MADEKTDPPAPRPPSDPRPAKAREDKLAKALRENLRRRKRAPAPPTAPAAKGPDTQD